MVQNPKFTEILISQDHEGMRLDRWLRETYWLLSQGVIEKALRKGDIRLNGEKVKASQRINPDDKISIFSKLLEEKTESKPFVEKTITAADRKFIKSLVIGETPDFWVLNKPSGLAVQGGTKTQRHVDHLIPALNEGDDEHITPKLVHRLDKETSGILLVAKHAKGARMLTRAFADHKITKTYMALVNGVPAHEAGEINLPLAKFMDEAFEKIHVDYAHGLEALTRYRVIKSTGEGLTWLSLEPQTGRTHQLRVHCAEGLRCPIVGDFKYGGKLAYPIGRIPMCLHARSLMMDIPGYEGWTISADLPPHMHDLF